MSRCAGAVLTLLVAASATAANLFVDVAGSGTACTQASPCALATALAQMAGGDTVYVAGGTYTGTGEQVMLLDRGLIYTLQGGWDGAGGGAVVVDPDANETILDGQNARRVITITSSYPTIRGFTITRGNATDLIATCQTRGNDASGCGGGIFAINSIPTIEGNVIEDNVASAVTPANKAGYGGGIMIDYNWPVIRSNVIRNNAASGDGAGFGGGVALHICTTSTTVEDNEISGNRASNVAYGGGGGIYTAYGTVAITDNLIEANAAGPAGTDAPGGGLYTIDTAPSVDRNVFVGNRGANAVYLSNLKGGWFAANRVVANPVAVALYVGYGKPDFAFPVRNNVVSDGGTVNVVLAGSEQYPLLASLFHNTLVGNGNNIGVRAYAHTDVALVNNIVAYHGNGIYDSGADQLVVNGTLFWRNTLDGVRGTNALDGNPDFANLLLRDYHIRAGSSAVDTAADTPVVTDRDLDGQARPAATALRDIGADELPPTRFDLGTATSPVAAGYTRLTGTDRYDQVPGYGWQVGAVDSRSRGAGTALTRDFNFTRAATFALDLPNGTYDVRMTMGDASYAHDQMRVGIEGVIVDTISTAKAQFVAKTWRTRVDDGMLSVAISDLGGDDPNAVVNAIEVRDPAIVKVDFGTAGSPVAPGFARATQATGYSDALRLGWMSGLVGSRDRGSADPLTRDFCVTGDATFRLGLLPSEAAYEVLVTVGDAAYAHDQMRIKVGGSELWKSTDAGQFVNSRHLVGGGGASGWNLDIRLTDMGGSDANVVVNAVQTEPRAEIKLDFGTATSPLEAGNLRVAAESRYRPAVGYGWLAGTIDARDRGTGTPSTRDLNFTAKGTFVVDLPRGVYWVKVAVGDKKFAHDLMKATVEGVEIGPATTPAGDYVVLESGLVAVNDGQLTVELEDLGGSDPYVSVLYMEIEL